MIVVSPLSTVESLSERNHVVRERTFSGPDILSVIYRLTLEKFTGRIVIHMGQGGVNSVVAEEQMPTNGAARNGGNRKSPQNELKET